MKKGLLLTLLLGFGFWSFGQNLLKTDYKQNNQPVEPNYATAERTAQPTGPLSYHKGDKGNVSLVTVGYSANVYTALVEQQSAVSINESLDLIQVTHRGKVGSNSALSSGDIISNISTDGGNTWHGFPIISAANGYYCRYPSGAIFNPAANANVSDAFGIAVGPCTDGANWVKTFGASIKFDSTSADGTFFDSHGSLIRMGMSVTSDDKVHVIGTAYKSTPVYLLDTAYLMTGTFNVTNSNFDWSFTKFKPNFIADTDGGAFAYVWAFNTAWSADGTIGYVWTIGRDSSLDVRSYQPIVWKSINSGSTWSKMPVYDFSNLSVITDYLQPMKGVSPDQSRPNFSSTMEGVVDANGNLHLIALVKASSSDNIDSLGYSYYVANSSLSNPIFDVYTTSAGWNARHLGDIYTIAVPAAESGYGSGTNAIGWDSRLQAAKSADGTKIFASWADTDTTMAPTGASNLLLNMFPDIYAVGWDVVSNKQTETTNFTIGTSLYGDCYFHYMSDLVFTDNGTYTLPITEIDKDNDPGAPITHNYIKGISFVDADFITNSGFNSTVNNQISVSQNRPNPFTTNTQIDVNLDKASNLSIEVINITGQKVYEMNYGTKNSGTHTLNLNAGNLANGVYFYTVRAGKTTVTKKMIVN